MRVKLTIHVKCKGEGISVGVWGKIFKYLGVCLAISFLQIYWAESMSEYFGEKAFDSDVLLFAPLCFLIHSSYKIVFS